MLKITRQLILILSVLRYSASFVRNELMPNVSSASIRFDAIHLDGLAAKTLSKKTKPNNQIRYLDVIETYNNCSGLEVITNFIND